MTNHITQISYDGPFLQLSTAPANFSITVRDLYALPTMYMPSQDATNNSQTQQDESCDTKINANLKVSQQKEKCS